MTVQGTHKAAIDGVNLFTRMTPQTPQAHACVRRDHLAQCLEARRTKGRVLGCTRRTAISQCLIAHAMAIFEQQQLLAVQIVERH